MKKLIFILSLFAGVLSAQTNYYSLAAGSLDIPATWGTNADGSGAHPANFTTANQIFNVSNANPGNIAASWTVSGAGSKIVVTNGNSLQNTASFSIAGTVDVNNGGTLTLVHAAVPTLGTMGATSTVIYSGSNKTMSQAVTYGNLTISTTQNLSSSIVVAGTLTLTNILILNNGCTLSLGGTIAGAASFSTSATPSSVSNPNFIYTGAGTITYPSSASGNNIRNFTNSSTGTIIISGVGVRVNNSCSNAGTIDLNTHVLAIGHSTCLGASYSGAGVVKGPGQLWIDATNAGTILMDQTTSATKTITTLNMNANCALTFGSNAMVSGTATFYDGSNLNIGTNTLEFNSTVSLSGTGTGTLTSSPTGTVIYNAAVGQTVQPFTYGNLTLQGARTTNNIVFSSVANTKVSGVLTNSATFTTGKVSTTSNTVEFNGVATTIAGTAFTFNKILVSSGTFTAPAVLTTTGSFVNNAITVGGATTLTIGAGLTNTGTFTPSTTTNVTGSITNSGTFNAATTLTATTTLSNTAGTFNASTTTIINGAVTNNSTFSGGTTSTFRAGLTNTGTYTPSTTTNVTGSITNSGTFNAGNTLTATTTLTNSAGTFNASPTTTITGTVTNNATMIGSTAFNIGGDFTNNSTFTHNSGTVNMNGAAAQTINGTSANTFYNLSVNTTAVSTRTVTVGGTGSSIVNDLTINGPATSGMLTFNPASLVTILSVAGQTARIAPVANDTRVTFSGSFNVNRFCPGGTTDWTNMCAPGVTGLTFSPWDNTIYITCPTCPDGYTFAGQSFTSITNYSETAGGAYDNAARYVGINAITDALTHGQGWWVYLGDGNTTTNPLSLFVTGPAYKGTKTFNLTVTGGASTDHGWNLLGNPYASPLSWASLWAANGSVDNEIQVYNPDIADFAIYSGGVSTPAVAAGGVDDHIPMGQAFYVHANAAATLTAIESTKTSSQNALLKTTKPTQTVFRLAIDGGGKNRDETVLHFNSNATKGWDYEYDAHKRLSPPTSDPKKPRITTVMGETEYSINGLPSLTEDISIPVMVKTKTTGQYTISPVEIGNLPSDACIILHDNKTGYDQDLRKGPYTFTLESATTSPRFNLNISGAADCKLASATNGSASSTVNIGQDATGTFVKFNYSEQTKTVISVTNVLGQKVMPDINADVTGDAVYLDLGAHNNQLLIINVISGNSRTVRKIFNQ